MKLRTRFALAGALCLHLLAASGALADECQIAETAMKRASELRGLAVKRSVPCLLHDKEEVKGYILHTIQNDLPPRKLELESIANRAIGLIPDDFDYEKGLVDLYLSQLGGYYDPKKKHYVMAAWMPAMLQTSIAVHELTHALQDQHFDIGKLIDPKIESSDILLAHSALVEGDATAVMIDFARGGRSIAAEKSVQSVMMQNILGATMTSALSSAPQSLQMMLIFPYTSGLRFVHSLLREGGYARVSEAFANPPRSTEEILHPEKYAKREPDYVEIPDADLALEDLPAGAELVYRDTVGEFSISALLGRTLADKLSVAEASAGWGGDRLAIFEPPGGPRWIVWNTRWDSPSDRDDFESHYRKAMKQAYPAFGSEGGAWQKVSSSKSIRIQKHGDAGVLITVRMER